jgi:hypothetical protein
MSATIHPEDAGYGAVLLSLYEAALLVFGQKLSELRAAG